MIEMMSAVGSRSVARVRQGFARLYPGINFQTWYPVARPLDAAGFFIRYEGRERHVWRSHFELSPYPGE